MATLEYWADIDLNNVAKVVGLQDGTNPQDAATVAQLNAAIEGLNWKDSTRVSTQGNLSIASPGATIDGISMAANDRVLVRSQTSQPENGIYIWNGAAVPMTRSADASTFPELEQATTTVEEGTNAGSTYRQTTVNGTLGTNNVVFTTFGTAAGAASETSAGIAEIATQSETDTGTDDARFITPLKLASWSGRVRRFSASFGDNSATSFAHTHNFNTRDVVVEVAETAGSFRTVFCEVQRNSVNQVTTIFNTAPTTNQYRVTIIA